jgi:hypothetical protein
VSCHQKFILKSSSIKWKRLLSLLIVRSDLKFALFLEHQAHSSVLLF